MKHSSSRVFYFIGAIESHLQHALPLYWLIGGTFVVSSKKTKRRIERNYNLPVILIENTDSIGQKITNKAYHYYGKRARHLTLGKEYKKTFEYLEKNAKVVIFYELYGFTKYTLLHRPKTIFLTHGNFLKDYFGMYPKRIDYIKDYDYMAGLGPKIKENLLKMSYVSNDKIIDIGIARTDEVVSKKTTKDSLLLRISLPKDNLIVSYIPTFFGSSSVDNVGLDIVSLINSDISLLVKLHPQTPKKLVLKYKKIIKNKRNIKLIEDDSTVPLVDILQVSDVIIGDLSSVMLEAILLDKPMIFAGDKNTDNDYALIKNIYDYCQKINSNNVQNINLIVKKSYKNGINKKKWDETKNQLFYDYDGTATQNIAKFIISLY